MAQKILITNFTFNVSPQEFENMTSELAPAFAEVPGCEWKIWLIERDKKQAGAVYLFKDDDALQSFKLSPLVASVLSHPALSDFDLRERDILEAQSLVTFAPIHASKAVTA